MRLDPWLTAGILFRPWWHRRGIVWKRSWSIAGQRDTGIRFSYLENARGDMFTAIENRLEGKTTSRIERLFRTVNMRVNVIKWSVERALNVTKVLLAYYYNGFDA